MARAQDELDYLMKIAVTNPDEPVFTLRAQDKHAADLVRKWAHFANVSGCPIQKVNEALRLADDMDAWPVKKFPD